MGREEGTKKEPEAGDLRQEPEAEAGSSLLPASRPGGSVDICADSLRKCVRLLLPDLPDQAVCGNFKLSVHFPEYCLPPGGGQHGPVHRPGRAAAAGHQPAPGADDQRQSQMG